MDPQAVLSALANPTRLQVLARLAEGGPSTATELSRSLPVTRQAVVKHLAALGAAGLVERSPEGREVRYSVDPAPLDGLAEWAREVGDTWERRLDRLRRAVE